MINISVTNIFVDPVAFLLLNNVHPPDHWEVNITHVPDTSLTSPLHLSDTVNRTSPARDYNVDSVASTWTAYDWVMTSTPGMFGLIPGVANPTGVVLLLVLAVMAICSMKWVRKSGNFEVNEKIP